MTWLEVVHGARTRRDGPWHPAPPRSPEVGVQPRELTIADAAAAMEQGDLSSVELVSSCLEQIESLNTELKAFIELRPTEDVLADARRADSRRADGRRGLLDGIPIGLKANFAYAGIPTSAGSKILADWRPSRDAAAVANLRRAGAVVLGMTNMHEFADGPTNDNAHFGRPLNPHDPSRTPGGSSGGSAVAVQTNMCLAATGSDDGGSIRVPSAFCGVVGLKPTYGLVSVEGIVPFSPSLDHAGSLASTPTDALTVVRGMTGGSTVCAAPIDHQEAKLVVGIERQYFGRYLQPGVRRAFDDAVGVLAGLGFEVREVALPSLEKAASALLIILFSEAATLHQRLLETNLSDYSEDVRLSLLSGRFYRAVDYLNARAFQGRFREEVDRIFTEVDVLVTPTAVLEPPVWDSPSLQTDAGEVELLEAIIRCTGPFDLCGHPAMSVPCGRGDDGLPVGLQLVGPWRSEQVLTDVADTYLAARGE